MAEIKAIIFDLEGVVIDSESVWTNSDLQFLKNHGVSLGLAEFERDIKPLLMGLVLGDGIALMKKMFDFAEDIQTLSEERRAIVSNLFGNDVTFIRGFTEFHQSIRDSYPTAVATSLERAFLSHVDKRLALSRIFSGNLHSVEDIGFISKPDPAIFLYAANSLGVKPENCLVIEDAPHGVEAAIAAGMRCVALTTSSPREKLMQANVVAASYEEINLSRL